MNDLRDALDRLEPLYRPPEEPYEGLLHLRDRKERNRRFLAATFAIIFAIVSFAALTGAPRGAGPASQPRPPGIFSEVGGWIAYGNADGIWAVDPSHPSDRESQVRLSSSGGSPLAWSSDGSELLISRPGTALGGLFMLHADGKETRLVAGPVSGASVSPDGTTVVFAPKIHASALDPGIYVIDAGGGAPSLLLEPKPRYFPDEDRSILTDLSLPTFSPDGTQIAYIDGLGDWGNSLRVMNADGTNAHVLDGSNPGLLDVSDASSVGSLGMHPNGLSWSPDGTHLAVGLLNPGIFVVDADGAGLTLTVPDGANPYWSPDGTRISYQLGGANQNQLYWPISPLMIAAADGTGILEFGYAGSGPWNPLVQAE